MSGEKEYLNGEYNGKYKRYYSNGNLMDNGEYINGERKGKWKTFYQNGNLKREIEFVIDSEGYGKEYFNGRLEFEGKFKIWYNWYKWDGKGYDENGNIIYELINGNGKVKEYYDTESLRYEGEYLNGKKMEKEKNIQNMVN